MAPPVNDFLKKRIFRPCRKQVTIEIAGLGIKENEYRHGGGLWKMWRVHGSSGSCVRGSFRFSLGILVGTCWIFLKYTLGSKGVDRPWEIQGLFQVLQGDGKDPTTIGAN